MTSPKQSKLFIDDNLFVPEVAITLSEHELGLMHRDHLPDAMVFLYHKPQINRFWMKATKKALDILFCHDNKIISIKHGTPFSTNIIGDFVPSDLVIELPFGKCDELGIESESIVKLELTKDLRKKFWNHSKLFRF